MEEDPSTDGFLPPASPVSDISYEGWNLFLSIQEQDSTCVPNYR